MGKETAQFLVNALQEHYMISVDWKDKKYVGLMLDWDYDRREGHLLMPLMPGYVEKALKRFGHTKPKKRQDLPHEHVPHNYGAKQQFAKQETDSPSQQI